MSRRFAIPLSYNPVPTYALATKLGEYSERHHNDIVEDFEAGIRALTHSSYAVGLSSGTAAIHLGLKALGVEPGDRVIVPTFTYVASVNPILYLNAIPIFVDSEPETWNMDPGLLEAAIRICLQDGNKPKAMIVVHTYGMPARMKEILEISARFQIPILEDAAEAIGSSFEGKPLGSLGRLGVISFNNNKILTTYGGGVLITDHQDVASQAQYWATHSRKDMPYYEHEEIGYNYRMGPINAAVGAVGLGELEKNVATHKRTFENYIAELGNIAGVSWQREHAGACSNRWITCLQVERNLKRMRDALDKESIETRPVWKPMHLQPLYKKYTALLNGTAQQLFEKGVCLPSGHCISTEKMQEIIGLVKRQLS